MSNIIATDGLPFDEDRVWFAKNYKRLTRIRMPRESERDSDFQTLGDHDRSRRRIVCLKIPETKQILTIPFLAFGDETIENDDLVLLPIIHEIMESAAEEYGMPKKMVKIPAAEN